MVQDFHRVMSTRSDEDFTLMGGMNTRPNNFALD